METIYIAAGGTAGHINAAKALGQEYKKKYNVLYITGVRHLDYKLFKDENVFHLNSKPLRGTNPFSLIINLFLNMLMFFKLIFKSIKDRPKFLLGAGGYVCGPTLLAGYFTGRSIFILEQNAFVGLTNKLLARFAKKIFVNFEVTKGLESNSKTVLSGNPIRKTIKFSEQKLDGKIKVLVYGGSLGSKQINDAVSLLAEDQKYNILHQVGKADSENLISVGNYKQVEYIDDMQKAYDWANVIIARAGASTVSELKVVSKPCILIPFPNHADNHQVYNAEELKRSSEFPVFPLDKDLYKNELKSKIDESIGRIDFTKKYQPFIEKNSPYEVIEKVIKECME